MGVSFDAWSLSRWIARVADSSGATQLKRIWVVGVAFFMFLLEERYPMKGTSVWHCLFPWTLMKKDRFFWVITVLLPGLKLLIGSDWVGAYLQSVSWIWHNVEGCDQSLYGDPTHLLWERMLAPSVGNLPPGVTSLDLRVGWFSLVLMLDTWGNVLSYHLFAPVIVETLECIVSALWD